MVDAPAQNRKGVFRTTALILLGGGGLLLWALRTTPPVDNVQITAPSLTELRRLALGDDERASMAAIGQLGVKGEAGLAILRETLKLDGGRAAAACVVLARLRGAARTALPDLQYVALHGDMQVRTEAMWAMVYVDPSSVENGRILGQGSQDDRPQIQLAVAVAAGDLDKLEDARLRGFLLASCTAKELGLRQAAVGAVSRRMKDDPKALEALIAATHDPDENVRTMAVRGVSDHLLAPARREEVRKVLIAGLKDPESAVSIAACEGAERLLVTDQECLDILSVLANDPHNDLRVAASKALQVLKAPSGSNLPGQR